MKIGIIGSNGFIGNNLQLFLKKTKKYKVYSFFSYKKNKSNWIRKVSDEIKLYKPDIIVNCAANQSSKENNKDIIGLIDSNIKANVLFLSQATKNKNFRGFITFGTKWEFNEFRKFQPLNFYATTKYANDIFLKYFSIKKNVTTVSLKIFDTYGKNDKRNRILNLLLKNYKLQKFLKISPGNQFLDYVHILDLCSLIETIFKDIYKNKLIGFNSYTVSSKKPLKLRSLIKELNNILNKNIKVKIGAKKYRKNEAMKSIKKINNYPGWKPKFKLLKELKKIFDEK